MNLDKINNLWKKLVSWYEKRTKDSKKEINRSLDFLESDLFYFLKLIFTKKEIYEDDLITKRHLSLERFNLLRDLSISRGYVIPMVASVPRFGTVYGITSEGIDYLLGSEKIRAESKSSDTIKWATIVLAISAFVQLVDIWVNKPETKSAVLNLIWKTIGLILEIIRQALPFIIVFSILILILKIIKKRRSKKVLLN